MERKLRALIGGCLLVLLSACGQTSDNLDPALSLSFEELQSRYAQEVGVAACTAFMAGDYSNAARLFRILEAVVPEWEDMLMVF